MIGRVLRALTKRRHRYVYRDAETGEFVTKAFAQANPTTTVKESVDG